MKKVSLIYSLALVAIFVSSIPVFAEISGVAPENPVHEKRKALREKHWTVYGPKPEKPAKSAADQDAKKKTKAENSAGMGAKKAEKKNKKTAAGKSQTGPASEAGGMDKAAVTNSEDTQAQK